MHDHATQSESHAGPQRCDPCAIPAFCRSYFYTGKLLTERDLTAEQRYFIDKLRLHYVALHGWGVVCGLLVKPHPQCSDRVVITEGFAVDDCGREIRLLEDHVIELPRPKKEQGEFSPPDPRDEDEEHRRRREPQAYYLCVRYAERADELSPAPYDECGCAGKQNPNRICEGYCIEISDQPPQAVPVAHKHRRCEEEDCDRLYSTISERCPEPGRYTCIPLAKIEPYCPGEPLKEDAIDNAIRPILPSARLLEQLIQCALSKLPKAGRELTRIRWFNWEHNGRYDPAEFLSKWVGAHDNPLAFEVHFERPVRAQGLNRRSFQAMIIREPLEPHHHRALEIAPARVGLSEDRLRCSLHIDPEYAQHWLRDADFDLHITLNCDVVLDDRGRPVDGNLLARLVQDEERDYVVAPPTGDGVAGGRFESWIRVRRAH